MVGVYLSEHPLQRLAGQLANVVTAYAHDIDETMAGQRVTLAGMISWIRPHITRRGDPMAFVQLEDLQGIIEVVVFPSIYKDTEDLWQGDKILVVQGRVDSQGREPKIICESVRDYVTVNRPAQPDRPKPPEPLISPLVQHLRIEIRRTGDQEQDIRLLGRVHDLLHRFEGRDRFSLYLADGRRRIQLEFPNDTTGYCSALVQQLAEMLGQGAVQLD